jgi:hypothetical protein
LERKSEGIWVWISLCLDRKRGFYRRGRWHQPRGMSVGFQPGTAFFFSRLVPRVGGFQRMGSQIASKRGHPHQPEVLAAGETALPARSGPAVEEPVRERGAITDRA